VHGADGGVVAVSARRGRPLAGLDDRPRKAQPRTTLTDEVRDGILTATLRRPPAELGITHWSSRLLAAAVRTTGQGGLA
jgi:hypothetical protein